MSFVEDGLCAPKKKKKRKKLSYKSVFLEFSHVTCSDLVCVCEPYAGVVSYSHGTCAINEKVSQNIFLSTQKI